MHLSPTSKLGYLSFNNGATVYAVHNASVIIVVYTLPSLTVRDWQISNDFAISINMYAYSFHI